MVTQPPKKSAAREGLEKVVEAGAGAVPLVGAPLAVAWAYAIGYTYNRRMQAWLEELADAVSRLEELVGGKTFEELLEDDVFADAVVNATRAAAGTHQREKLEALRNAVLNSLGPDAPSVDEQARFIRLVDEFTPAHLRLLSFMQDPGATFDRAGIPRPDIAMGSRTHLLEQCMPEFVGRQEWYQLLHSDIQRAGLTNGSSLGGMMTGAGVWTSTLGPMGQRFMTFIGADEPGR